MRLRAAGTMVAILASVAAFTALEDDSMAAGRAALERGDIHAARAETNYARGEEALRKYLGGKPADGEHAHAWFFLGLIQEKQGRKAEARQSYLNARKLLPEMKDLPEALKRVS